MSVALGFRPLVPQPCKAPLQLPRDLLSIAASKKGTPLCSWRSFHDAGLICYRVLLSFKFKEHVDWMKNVDQSIQPNKMWIRTEHLLYKNWKCCWDMLRRWQDVDYHKVKNLQGLKISDPRIWDPSQRTRMSPGGSNKTSLILYNWSWRK